MTCVYVLIQVKAGKVWEVREDLEQIPGISEANVVTGPYDIIAYGEPSTNDETLRLLDSIHEVKSVTRSETCMSIKSE
jgi:DNA-binding Lrp family transcriptional regulator